MLGQGANAVARPRFVYSLAFFHLAVCGSYDLIRERVRTITFFSHFCASFRSRDLVCVFMNKISQVWVVTPTDLRPACQLHGRPATPSSFKPIDLPPGSSVTLITLQKLACAVNLK